MRSEAVDDEGYLLDPAQWSEDFALASADDEGIDLSADHWDVLRFMRGYYAEHQLAPDARFAIKHLAIRFGADARTRLFDLFPYGYVRQACKIAGMKRPRAWSTG